MSLTAEALPVPAGAGRKPRIRIAAAAVAVALVAGAIAGTIALLTPQRAREARNPFGMGLREARARREQHGRISWPCRRASSAASRPASPV